MYKITVYLKQGFARIGTYYFESANECIAFRENIDFNIFNTIETGVRCISDGHVLADTLNEEYCIAKVREQ